MAYMIETHFSILTLFIDFVKFENLAQSILKKAFKQIDLRSQINKISGFLHRDNTAEHSAEPDDDSYYDPWSADDIVYTLSHKKTLLSRSSCRKGWALLVKKWGFPAWTIMTLKEIKMRHKANVELQNK